MWLFRTLALIEYEVESWAIRGFFSDFVLALWLTAGVELFNRLKQKHTNKRPILIMRSAIYALLCIIAAANYENIIALDASLLFRNLHYLADPEFRSGSFTLSITSILALATCAITGLIGLKTKPSNGAALKWTLLVLPMCNLWLHFWAEPNQHKSWATANILSSNIVSEWRALRGKSMPHSVSPSQKRIWEDITRPDLNGKKRYSGSKSNVLLILVESVSGHTVNQPASAKNIIDQVTMPKLADRAKTNINFSHFIAPQVQTNRGEYTLLCGDLPNLATDAPKMLIGEQIMAHRNKRCLPEILKDNGYSTSYLQAANLRFMGKSDFMPAIGFQHVFGQSWFKKPYLRHPWGVADRDFFKQSLREVERLESLDKPWFLTLLTVGTHHNYKVPDDAKIAGMKPYENAIRHLDDVLDDYIRELETKGILDNTLVIITADESKGSSKDNSHLSQNWVPFIIIDQHAYQSDIPTPYTQTDLSLSVLDYLNITQISDLPQGRSIFREYQSPRPFVFGHFHDLTSYLFEHNQLHQCDYYFTTCRSWQYPDHQFIWHSAQAKPLPTSSRATNQLHYVTSQSDWDFERFFESPVSLDGHTPWIGFYFQNMNLNGKYLVREDEKIDFKFGQKAPMPGFPSERFGIKWISCLSTAQTVKMKADILADEGFRLSIDQNQVLDKWSGSVNKRSNSVHSLKAGNHLIEIEYRDFYYDAHIKVELFSLENNTQNEITSHSGNIHLAQPSVDKNGSLYCAQPNKN